MLHLPKPTKDWCLLFFYQKGEQEVVCHKAAIPFPVWHSWVQTKPYHFDIFSLSFTWQLHKSTHGVNTWMVNLSVKRLLKLRNVNQYVFLAKTFFYPHFYWTKFFLQIQIFLGPQLSKAKHVFRSEDIFWPDGYISSYSVCPPKKLLFNIVDTLS